MDGEGVPQVVQARLAAGTVPTADAGMRSQTAKPVLVTTSAA